MSYQFEDESALEELLNQQLDRRKQQAKPSRPSTGVLRPVGSALQPRPSTASNTVRQRTDDNNNPSSLLLDRDGSTTKSKLSAWLEGDSGATGAISNHTLSRRPSTAQEEPTRRNAAQGRAPEPDFRRTQSDEQEEEEEDNLEATLGPARLQEMSKQGLIQLVRERVVPKLAELRRGASKHAAQEVERLRGELRAEQGRREVLELRHEEQLRLEQQRSGQLTSQLETRLAQTERELTELLERQKAHLDKLEAQHRASVGALSENYEQRLRQDKEHFEELMRARDEMHKLELESRLKVDCNLSRLDTIQAEWRQTLASTIGQLETHFESVEALLDKQTLQVRGTNGELAAKTAQLGERYAKLEACSGQLMSVASQMDVLLPGLAEAHRRGETLQGATERLLEDLRARLALLDMRERALEASRTEFEGARTKLEEDRLRLTLESARVQMKEERLGELLATNEERERTLASERATLLEQTTQAQIKRVSLDERAADLKEQNYTLHLLRKRLTHQREELVRAQASLGEERKAQRTERAQASAETKRLVTLRERVQRELDQLRRLQRALVCSLCMGRLFGGAGAESQAPLAKYEQQFEMPPPARTNTLDITTTAHESSNEKPPLFGQLAAWQEAAAAAPAATNGDEVPDQSDDDDASALAAAKSERQEKTMANVERRVRSRRVATHSHAPAPGNDLDLELRQTELESGRLAAESKYIEQLMMAS